MVGEKNGEKRVENGIEHVGEPMSWYAMSVPYNRVLKVKSMLDAEGIEAFVPMRFEVRTVRGKKVRLYVPAVSNLLFVHTTDSRLRLFKQTTTFLQYLVRRGRTMTGWFISNPRKSIFPREPVYVSWGACSMGSKACLSG